MHSIQSALFEAFEQTYGSTEELEKRLRKARFERASERGRQLMLNATKATRAGRFADALAEVQRNRYDCAAYIAAELSKERRRFVRVQVGFSELELMERLWKEKIREQDAPAPSPALSRNGKPTEARIAS